MARAQPVHGARSTEHGARSRDINSRADFKLSQSCLNGTKCQTSQSFAEGSTQTSCHGHVQGWVTCPETPTRSRTESCWPSSAQRYSAQTIQAQHCPEGTCLQHSSSYQHVQGVASPGQEERAVGSLHHAICEQMSATVFAHLADGCDTGVLQLSYYVRGLQATECAVCWCYRNTFGGANSCMTAGAARHRVLIADKHDSSNTGVPDPHGSLGLLASDEACTALYYTASNGPQSIRV